MIRRGCKVIFICACLITPIPYPPKCPHADEIADAIRAIGVRVVMGAH